MEVREPSGLSVELLARCRDAFCTEPPRVSRLQKDVLKAVRRMGFEVEGEVRDEVTGYLVDMVIELEEEKGVVAIEVDGPAHFVGKHGKANGETLLKRRLLQRSKLGRNECRLVSIPYWEWDAVAGKSGGKIDAHRERVEEYLCSKLGL